MRQQRTSSAAVMNFALIIILGLAITLSAQISNRTPVSLLNANASIQRATKGARTSLGQSGRGGAYSLSKSEENTGNTTMADTTVPVRIHEVQSRIPCDVRCPWPSFASAGICVALATRGVGVVEFGHGAFHIFAGGIGAGADALDAQPEIVRIGSAQDGFFERDQIARVEIEE
jgi:hypothetical protein